MWTTNKSNKVAPAIMIGAATLLFNTHAHVDLEHQIKKDEDKTISSNLSGSHWTSTDLNKPQEAPQAMLGIADIVSMVKITLGLPNKDIANIFGVSRPTLDSYKNLINKNHTVNKTNMRRALTLAEIIKEIKPKFTRSPGAVAKNYTIQGESLLDLLQQDELSISKILKFSDSIAEKMSSNTPKGRVNETSLYELTKTV